MAMNIAQTIYQHVKAMPMEKAVEVLHFIEFLETKQDVAINEAETNDVLEFMQTLPLGQRIDADINTQFQALRDEWEQSAHADQFLTGDKKLSAIKELEVIIV
jgi:Protein of unknown function (DUF2281)